MGLGAGARVRVRVGAWRGFQRANFSVSLAVASWKLLTGPSQKKKPNMPEMLPPG